MLNGRYDYGFPMKTSQLVMFRLLGTPLENKRHVSYEDWAPYSKNRDDQRDPGVAGPLLRPGTMNKRRLFRRQRSLFRTVRAIPKIHLIFLIFTT